MATSQLLLIKPVEDLGHEGDEVSVKAGYARNYLLPRGYAVPVTRANRKQVEVLRARSEARRKSELEAAQATAARIEALSIALAVRTGPGGKVFGSITAQDLINRLKEEGVELEKKQVALYTPARSLGKHTTRIRLHADVAVDFEFEIVSENPIEDEQSEAQA